MKTPSRIHTILVCILSLCAFQYSFAAETPRTRVTVSSLAEFATAAAQNDRDIVVKPGIYRMADYVTADVLRQISAYVDHSKPRPPVPMLLITGSGNHIDLTGVTLEIDTTLYAKVPQGGYTRCIIIDGANNTLTGLTIRNTGPVNRGSNGNILSVAGPGNTLNDFTLHVVGSSPFGYGDLLGKGGPNLVSLQKQSGIQVLGSNTTLRRCKVISRAFGHCYYIQAGENIRLEDCYAEGITRSTNEMLSDTDGPAAALNFPSVYLNRDGRHLITPGYIKSLTEDGFRTYGGAGSVTLVNCTATNTRAGFEIGARDDATTNTIIENCTALGCERAYLIGSHTIVRRSRGDITHGPLLYLRGGLDSDVELELTGQPPQATVHVLATIAGTNHRVRLTAQPHEAPAIHLPIMLGYGMPEHAEMASPINPAPTKAITLINEIATATVITDAGATDITLTNAAPTLPDATSRQLPKGSRGAWPTAPGGIAR